MWQSGCRQVHLLLDEVEALELRAGQPGYLEDSECCLRLLVSNTYVALSVARQVFEDCIDSFVQEKVCCGRYDFHLCWTMVDPVIDLPDYRQYERRSGDQGRLGAIGSAI